jgi:UDP-2,3-diacylglucosamine pyrophosphatase LpxH
MDDKNAIIDALNAVADKHRGNIFRVLTGDLIENQLKTSVGHNYDPAIADPAVQAEDMIDILTDTNKYLYGTKEWNRISTKKFKNVFDFTDIRCVGVEGNHEYRTRKTSGQWISSIMHTEAKVLDMKMDAIIELTIENKKLKKQATYRMFVSHRLSKTDSCSPEAMIRGFAKKQSTLPGIDLIVMGHTHKRFLSPGIYTDVHTGETKKVLYVVNPSPMGAVEYAQEAGYPPLDSGYYINVHLPLDSATPIWGTV